MVTKVRCPHVGKRWLRGWKGVAIVAVSAVAISLHRGVGLAAIFYGYTLYVLFARIDASAAPRAP
jgi:hypothetical protein